MYGYSYHKVAWCHHKVGVEIVKEVGDRHGIERGRREEGLWKRSKPSSKSREQGSVHCSSKYGNLGRKMWSGGFLRIRGLLKPLGFPLKKS